MDGGEGTDEISRGIIVVVEVVVDVELIMAEAVSASLGMYLVASAATSWFLKRAMAWSGPGARASTTRSSSATSGEEVQAPILKKSSKSTDTVEQKRAFSSLFLSERSFSLPFLCARSSRRRTRESPPREQQEQERRGPEAAAEKERPEALSLANRRVVASLTFFPSSLFVFLLPSSKTSIGSFATPQGTGAFSLSLSLSSESRLSCLKQRESKRAYASAPPRSLSNAREGQERAGQNDDDDEKQNFSIETVAFRHRFLLFFDAFLKRFG